MTDNYLHISKESTNFAAHFENDSIQAYGRRTDDSGDCRVISGTIQQSNGR